MSSAEVVITGVGLISPIGIGLDRFWASLCAGRSGVDRARSVDPSALPSRLFAEVADFDPKQYVKPRKAIKVMCRDAMLGVAVVEMARQQAGISAETVGPERLGVVLGADRICTSMEDSLPSYGPAVVDGRFVYRNWATKGMADTFPLNFLKVLPNMIGSHVSIVLDARGPNNTIHHGEVSSLLALMEAARVIERGAADVMVAGGASSETVPTNYVQRCVTRQMSRREHDPAAAIRPFDADRDGQVWGEGAAAFVLESRRHAEARGAAILGRLAGWASTAERVVTPGRPTGRSIGRALTAALEQAHAAADELAHLNAHGLSTTEDDPIEAKAVAQVLPEVPVTAPKSYFGNLGAAGGAVELAASLLALRHRLIPPTLNYQRPDPECPVRVVRGAPRPSAARYAVSLNWTQSGQAAAVVLAGES